MHASVERGRGLHGAGVPIADPREMDSSLSVSAWCIFCGAVRVGMGNKDELWKLRDHTGDF